MINIIQSRIYHSQLSLLKDYIIGQAMWKIIWQKFDISCILKICTIEDRVINKLFTEFASIDDYCWAYLEAYDEIANRLINKNSHKQQVKHHKIFLQEVILNKLLASYMPFISAIDKK